MTIIATSTAAGVLSTSVVTVTAQGGSGAYLYEWTPPPGVTASAPNGAITSFSKFMPLNTETHGAASCKVTDGLTGLSKTVSVDLAFSCYNPVDGSIAPGTVNGAVWGPGAATTNAATATGSGGSGAFTYTWTASAGVTITSPNAATTTFTETLANGASANATATCTITDTGTGFSKQVTVALAFTSTFLAPLAASITPPSVYNSTGAPNSGPYAANFTANPSGGKGNRTYSWAITSITGGGSAVISGSSTSASVSLSYYQSSTTSPSQINVSCTVLDVDTGETVTATCLINTTAYSPPPPPPQPPYMYVIVSPGDSTVYVAPNTTVTFCFSVDAHYIGGAPPTNGFYSWNGDGSPCVTVTSGPRVNDVVYATKFIGVTDLAPPGGGGSGGSTVRVITQ